MKKESSRAPYRATRLWIATVDYKGSNELTESFPTNAQAEQAIISHLREYHLYKGSNSFRAAMNWIAERDDRFDVQIIKQNCRLLISTTQSQGEGSKLPRVLRFLRLRGFVVLTFNRTNDADSRFEAWAYAGPLDFEEAAPVRFGLGADPVNALVALDYQLSRRAK